MNKVHAVFLVVGLMGGWLAAAHGKPPSRSRTLIPEFDNERVLVWKTILAPGERLGMHRHDHGRVVVALKGGKLALPQQNGGSKKLDLRTGHAYWLPADPPGELHGDDNESDHEIELMVVELRR